MRAAEARLDAAAKAEASLRAAHAAALSAHTQSVKHEAAREAIRATARVTDLESTAAAQLESAIKARAEAHAGAVAESAHTRAALELQLGDATRRAELLRANLKAAHAAHESERARLARQLEAERTAHVAVAERWTERHDALERTLAARPAEQPAMPSSASSPSAAGYGDGSATALPAPRVPGKSPPRAPPRAATGASAPTPSPTSAMLPSAGAAPATAMASAAESDTIAWAESDAETMPAPGFAPSSVAAAPSAAGAADPVAESAVDANWLDAARAKLLRDSEAWRASLATDMLDDDGDDGGEVAAATTAAAVGGGALGSTRAGVGVGVSSTAVASGADGFFSAMDNFAAIELRLAGSS